MSTLVSEVPRPTEVISKAPPDLTWLRTNRPSRCPYCAADARVLPCQHALGRHLTEQVVALMGPGRRATAQGYCGQPQLSGVWWLFDAEAAGRPHSS